MGRRRRRRPLQSRIRGAIRAFLAFLFSNVGTVMLVIGYTIAGAFMFQAIEGASEMERVTLMARERERTVQHLWNNVTLVVNPLDEKEIKQRVGNEIQRYQRLVVMSVRRGWDTGRANGSRQWSFSNAFLYSMTVITTIGYGHLSPRTNWGKVATIFYALLGMPLFLLYLSNVGSLFARWFKCVYALVCLCRGCPGFRRQRVLKIRDYNNLEISEPESIERPQGWRRHSDSDLSSHNHYMNERQIHQIPQRSSFAPGGDVPCRIRDFEEYQRISNNRTRKSGHINHRNYRHDTHQDKLEDAYQKTIENHNKNINFRDNSNNYHKSDNVANRHNLPKNSRYFPPDFREQETRKASKDRSNFCANKDEYYKDMLKYTRQVNNLPESNEMYEIEERSEIENEIDCTSHQYKHNQRYTRQYKYPEPQEMYEIEGGCKAEINVSHPYQHNQRAPKRSVSFPHPRNGRVLQRRFTDPPGPHRDEPQRWHIETPIYPVNQTITAPRIILNASNNINKVLDEPICLELSRNRTRFTELLKDSSRYGHVASQLPKNRSWSGPINHSETRQFHRLKSHVPQIHPEYRTVSSNDQQFYEQGPSPRQCLRSQSMCPRNYQIHDESIPIGINKNKQVSIKHHKSIPDYLRSINQDEDPECLSNGNWRLDPHRNIKSVPKDTVQREYSTNINPISLITTSFPSCPRDYLPRSQEAQYWPNRLDEDPWTAHGRRGFTRVPRDTVPREYCTLPRYRRDKRDPRDTNYYVNRQDTCYQRDYPQRDYPQRDYSQRDYPQRDYPQRDYPQRDYSQRDYPQRDYPQRDYPQRDYPQRRAIHQYWPDRLEDPWSDRRRGWSEPVHPSSVSSEFSYVTFDPQSITVPISVCVAIMAGYLIFGSMIFGLWEQWDLLDGAYFCFISLTSIGFGDFVPGERIYTPRVETSFIVCSLYLMLGMALVAMCFNLMQEQVIHYVAGLRRAFKRICQCLRCRNGCRR